MLEVILLLTVGDLQIDEKGNITLKGEVKNAI